MALDCSPFDALTFDCYGTLIDWERGILDALRPWADRAVPQTTDADLLAAFAQAEPAIERANPGAPYRDILRLVHGAITDSFGAPPAPIDAEAFANSVPDWPAFPDSPGALRALSDRYRLVIVSNVDGASFEGSQRRLGIEFDAVVTAECVGAYKPDHAMFEAAWEACAMLGVPKERILHVAQSLYHDHAPAKALGMTTVHVNRPPLIPGAGATPTPPAPVTPDLTVATMAEFADLALPRK
ncbi:MAG: haloacid dehalogenase type II [Phycisphaeraceae bacterium]|nr:haloacid dehalogenase type II [Phycisphaeraceae bacterium]